MSTITLSRFLIEQQRNSKLLPAELRFLLETVARACKAISHAVSKGALAGVLGEAGSGNVQGEAQKKLDVIANDVLLEANEWGGSLAGMASEEMELPYAIPGQYPKGSYLLLFDPLDGSSNIDVNISIGTIFSVLRCPDGVTEPVEADFLQPGTRQVAAGYTLYGPQTMLVLAFGSGVNGFTLDREHGTFVLTHPDMRVPEHTGHFAVNMSNQPHWDAPVQQYIGELLAGSRGPRGKDYNLRWAGSMAAEVHSILVRGGVFLYPKDLRQPARPGKLRLLYEGSPMAYLIEQAGGGASDGQRRLLDIQPQQLHERVAVFLGSREEIERIERLHAEHYATPTGEAR